MSHADTEIDFSNISLAAIVGHNGAGKSTILQGITYALWGEVRTASHNDVVRRGTSECAIRLDFLIDGEEYRVTRRRSLSGKGSSDLEFSLVYSIGYNVHVRSLTKPTIKETQAEIDRVVGLSYKVFANSALLQQGEASNFSNAQPAKRKELLGELIGLDELQKIEMAARKLHRETDRKHADACTSMGLINDELDYLEGCDNRLEVLLDLQQRIIKKIDVAKAQLACCEDDLDNITSTEYSLYTDKENLSLHKRIVEETQKDIECLYILAREAQSLIDDGEAIREAAAMREHLDKRFQELLANRDAWQEMNDIETATKLRDKVQKEIDDLTLELVACEGTLGEIDGEMVEIEDAIAEQDQRWMLYNGRLDMQKQIKHNLELNSFCPTCLQALGDRSRAIDQAVSTIDVTTTIMANISKEMEDSNAELIEHNSRLTSLETKREKLLQGIAELGGKLAWAEELMDGKELVDVDFDEDEYNAIQLALTEKEAIKDALVNLVRLEKAEQEREQARERISILAARRDSSQEQVDKISLNMQVLEDLLATLRDPNELRLEFEELKSQLAGLETNLSNATTDIGMEKANVERQDELKARYTKLELELAKLDNLLFTSDLLVRATSKTGAQALLIEAALPQIEADANGYLEVMSPNISIALESQKVTTTGKVSETLDIRVMADGKDAPIETLSGGERFRADLALRLAIGRLLARQSGTEMAMLAIDEGFGTQDADGVESIVETIQGLGSIFPLILVITHVGQVANSIGTMGSIIDVSKAGNESAVRME